MTIEKKNAINCKRLHRANMIFATISNDNNYICIITHNENDYNLELFSGSNQMQKIFRKTIPDSLNKVYINHCNKYICVTSQNGSIYILDMKGNLVYKNEGMHCLYWRKGGTPTKVIPAKNGYSKRKRKKETNWTSGDKDHQAKDNTLIDSIAKRFKCDKSAKKENSVVLPLNNNMKKTNNGKLTGDKNHLTRSGKNRDTKSRKQPISSNIIMKNEINKEDHVLSGNVLKSGTTARRYKSVGNEKEMKKQPNGRIPTRQSSNYNVIKPSKEITRSVLNRSIRRGKNNGKHTDCDDKTNGNQTNNKRTTDNETNVDEMEEKHSDVSIKSDSTIFGNYDFCLSKEVCDYFFSTPPTNRIAKYREVNELNSNTQYEKIPLEIVDIFWINVEKDNRNKCPGNYGHYYLFSYFDNVHIIHSLDVGFNVICSMNLKIILYKCNVLNHFYKNINSYVRLKNDIVQAFKKKFIRKWKAKNKYACVRSVKHNCHRNKMNHFNISMRRVNSLRPGFNAHNWGTTESFSFLHHLDVKESIIKRIFNDLVIDIKQSYISNEQHYILVNYYVRVKRKYLNFSSLEPRRLGWTGEPFIQPGSLPQKESNSRIRHNKFNLKRMILNREKENQRTLTGDKYKMCLLGMQKFANVQKEFRCVQKIILYLLHSSNILHSIFHIYRQMSSMYSKFKEYKKMHQIYRSIVELNDHFKRFYYRDRTIVYFSKFIKNRRENFDENLYNLFFKENEKRDFARYYDVVKRMISDNTICCTCSKEKFLSGEMAVDEQGKMLHQEKNVYQGVSHPLHEGEENGAIPRPNTVGEAVMGNQFNETSRELSEDCLNSHFGDTQRGGKKEEAFEENIKRGVLNSYEGGPTMSCVSDSIRCTSDINGRLSSTSGMVPLTGHQRKVIKKEPKHIAVWSKSTSCLQKMDPKGGTTSRGRINSMKDSLSTDTLELRGKVKSVSHRRQCGTSLCPNGSGKYCDSRVNEKNEKDGSHGMATSLQRGTIKNRGRNGFLRKGSGISYRQGVTNRLGTVVSTGEKRRCGGARPARGAQRGTCTHRPGKGKVAERIQGNGMTNMGNEEAEDSVKEKKRGDEENDDEDDDEEDDDDSDDLPLSEGELEEQYRQSRKFIVPPGQNICISCELLIQKKTIHNFEKFELNYVLPRKKKKMSDEEIYTSLIKDIYLMYSEQKCPVNLLLLLQEFSEKEVQKCMANFQVILNYYEKIFLENINEHLINLHRIICICKSLSDNTQVMLKTYRLDVIKKIQELTMFCVRKFQKYYNLQTHLNIFLFLIELLLFISKNIYFEKFPHYKEAFSNYRNFDVEILKNYNSIRENKKIHFNHFDRYLHNSQLKRQKFFLALCTIQHNLDKIFQSFFNRREDNKFTSIYNISILHLQSDHQFHYFTLPGNIIKYDPPRNSSYFSDDYVGHIEQMRSPVYPFYVCTCDRFSFLRIDKYYQCALRFKLIQRRAIGISLHPLTILNVVVISKNFFYIFTKNDKKLNITSLKVKYYHSERSGLKRKGKMDNPNNLTVVKCSNLESYYPSANSFNLRLQTVCNSIIANCELHTCLILPGL
ncbi:conserved Plasmodium protein, unknown function [Plasmodium knowlesi strain H]|uniref:Uncharacterized protein n=2 Tax=Plasmodium knowlesi TaxID=5850 RepID=B3L394_PLAKH|nr:conserved Plasmodium protein, unknown function [Plasmodium knowlesi strain H]OTN67419.1 Uncharacterized protein PKNOH_S06407700 [Plasmodium knowlesi]CAA9987352.1 conserved Plasmodium protein, unknown function [Plasmodium knowlesi strain H]VVS76826.1 conserved Plasmodium protein, unknown function [Plasmodium knowlesi strain H]|eukprot:XP_002258355.1 hypothetical protein, conserved in Plasmodium species [Plasmodium knowlesi strain H]